MIKINRLSGAGKVSQLSALVGLLAGQITEHTNKTSNAQLSTIKLLKEFLIKKPVEEAKAPKNWDSLFTTKVIDSYKSGKLTEDTIPEWDKEFNGGKTPNPPFNTKEILDYYLSTNKDPRD